MDLLLKDKIVIVTGAAKGIGKGIAIQLASEGAIPVIVGRNAADNQAVLEEITRSGGSAFQVCAELTSPIACEKVALETLKLAGRIDGLVNNAGVNDGVGLESGNYESFIQSLHKNVVHYYMMAHFCLPELKKNQGAIVNIGSKTAETGQGKTSGYAASNGARNALTREWAVELLPYRIRVNAVIVSECFTPLYEQWIKSFSDPVKKLNEITEKIPLEKRMTTEREIADAVCFLLSARSSHTTGQLIYVDGGYVHLDRAID